LAIHDAWSQTSSKVLEQIDDLAIRANIERDIMIDPENLLQPGQESHEASASTLDAVRHQFSELLPYLPTENVNYFRLAVFDMGRSDELDLELQASEKLNEKHSREFVLQIPPTDTEGAKGLSRVTLRPSEQHGIWEVALSDPNISFDKLVADFQPAANSLPRGITRVVDVIKRSKPAREINQWTRHVVLGNKELDELWDQVASDLDQLNAPTFYDYSHVAFLGDRTIRINAVDVLPREDGTLIPDKDLPLCYQNISATGDFSYSRMGDNGRFEASFYHKTERRKLTAELLELTEEDRKEHPYIVVPSSTEETDNNALPFRITSSGLGEDTGLGMEMYARTIEQGQDIADNRFRRQKALAGYSYDLTEDRAQLVLDTLSIVTENAALEALS
jgi:hypothetical protein